MRSNDDKEHEELNSNSSNEVFELGSVHEDQSTSSSNEETQKHSSEGGDGAFESSDGDDVIEHQGEKCTLKRKQSSTMHDTSPDIKRAKYDDQSSTQKDSQIEVSHKEITEDAVTEITSDAVLGPIPPEDCNIFVNYRFVVISTPTTDDQKPAHLGSPSRTPYSKSRLVKQICAAKGTLITNVEDKYKWFDINLLVIAESHVVTQSYLKALAIGRNCISHEWIVECCRENKFLSFESYLLPAGKSIMSDEIITRNERVKIFYTWSFAIVSHNTNSREYAFWKCLIELAGGFIVSLAEIHHALMDSPVDVLMIDKSYPAAEIQHLKQEHHVVVFTPDWIIECLIRGKIISHKKCSYFKFGQKN